jgi:acyl-CoA synthetase (AMP-forming)/AMP-acid ligase II
MVGQVATLIDSLEASRIAAPDKRAFSFAGRSTSFAAFARQSRQVAAALHAAGIRPGERIA